MILTVRCGENSKSDCYSVTVTGILHIHIDILLYQST